MTTAYKTVGKRAHKWAEAHPRLARTIANLRGEAGMSEEAIYYTLTGGSLRPTKKRITQPAAYRGILGPAAKPSIREMRAVFEKYDVGHGTIGGKKGLRIDPETGKPVEGHSEYRSRIKAQFSPHQRQLLDRKTTAGHLIRFGVDAQDWRDPEAFIEFEEGGFDTTPPF